MVDKKQKNQEDNSKKSLLHEVIQKTSATGEYQGQIIFDVQPWSMTNDKTGKTSSGYSMRVKIDKAEYGKPTLPDGSKNPNYKPGYSTTQFIDVGNSKIREILRRVCDVIESQ